MLIVTKPYVPHQNSITKGTSLGSTRPRNDPHCPKLCRLSCSFITNTPSKVAILAVLGTCKIPAQKFARCRHADTDSRLLFQKRSKSAQDKWPKVRDVLMTKTKHVVGSLDATPGGFPGASFVLSVHRDPSLIFRVSSRSVQVWRTYNRKPPPEPQSECNRPL